ncbi:hypothetical protein COLO4_07575 [Corchorus olitorius]|uniref:F-box domain-containing protein n=1 Tax=Corchorus olitorius TaxID=93759 RepID=A0A1R3KJ88_9ROSI|nr:hypothetical protein COLO4_07575 [Corchorus olitorius]
MPGGINLPHDILMEILCRLAVKDLLRLRCVSKSCGDLIDSPDFAKLHLSHALTTNSHRFLLLQRIFEPYSLDLDSLEHAQIKRTDLNSFTDLQVKFPIIGSCNGLIALETHNGDIVISNPITRKIRKVPRYSSLPASTEDEDVLVNYGFGYDPVSDDYKLVMLIRLLRHNGINKNQVDSIVSSTKIYSFKVGCWRSCFHEIPCNLFMRDNAILVNNALHWLIFYPKSSVVGFDLTSERHRDIQLPLLDKYTYDLMGIVELGDCLCMIGKKFYDWSGDSVNCDIWVMKEYGLRESWTKLFSLIFDARMVLLRPLAYSKCGQKVLFWIDNDMDRNRLVWYDLKGKSTENIEISIPDYKGIFVGSLVSPTAAGTNYGPKRKQA